MRGINVRPVASALCLVLTSLGVTATLPGTAMAEEAPSLEVRTTARYATSYDSEGKAWAPRQGWSSIPNTSTALANQDVGGTDDDALYQYVAIGASGYQTSVPALGYYHVRLLLVEPWFSAAGQRTFSVLAEGAAQASEIDLFTRNGGRGVAKDLTFDVYVSDGTLNLEFPATVNYSAVAGIEVTGPTPELPRAVRLAPSSFWFEDISQAPTAANSGVLATELNRQVTSYWNGVAAFNAYQYNTSFYTVPAGLPRITLGYYDCQNRGYTPTLLHTDVAPFVDVPIPDDAVPSVGNDGEITLYDPATDQLWEFWKLRRNPTTNAWEACWGGRIDSVSQNPGHFSDYWGASASGVIAASGMITMDDVRRGEINHAMYLAIPTAADWTRFSWPAQRSDGHSPDVDAIYEGQRLRLNPALDVDMLGLTPIGAMVARAAQKHGFIVADQAGAVALQTESGAYQKSKTGVDPWNALLGMPSYLIMQNFPWAQVQFLPVDYGKPFDPVDDVKQPTPIDGMPNWLDPGHGQQRPELPPDCDGCTGPERPSVTPTPTPTESPSPKPSKTKGPKK